MLEIENLTYIYGDNLGEALRLAEEGKSREEIRRETGKTLAVHKANFVVEKGEIFGVMGLSGSGKSTLLQCVNQLLVPQKGKVNYKGENLLELSDDKIRKLRQNEISMVFQEFGLMPHKTVIENVELGLKLSGWGEKERKEKAREVLRMVKLADWEGSRIQNLSGGMKQRVGLARALAIEPDLLLMDEPFSALDPLVREEMQDEFLNLHKKLGETSVLFITHDFYEAGKVSDRLVIMKEGKILGRGRLKEIIENSTSDYIKDFVDSSLPLRTITAGEILSLTPQQENKVKPKSKRTIPHDMNFFEVCDILQDGGEIVVLKGDNPIGTLAQEDIFNLIQHYEVFFQ